jgi:hypothetical protein
VSAIETERQQLAHASEEDRHAINLDANALNKRSNLTARLSETFGILSRLQQQSTERNANRPPD